MNKSQKLKLMDYLYPNEEARSFICNDLYQELLKYIPSSLLISTDNIPKEKRLINIAKVKQTIITFLIKKNYERVLLKKIGLLAINNDVIEELITGLTFFVSNTEERCKDVDIFKDKKSICYQEISIIDVLDNKPKKPIVIEDVIYQQMTSLDSKEFQSSKLRQQASDFEKEFRETLNNKQKQSLTDLIELFETYHAQREYEIVCYVINFIQSIFKK
ncbi:MAG: hypothetical protein ACI4R8_03645 [Candidatus Caccovivens sp.]